jgi:hypothetical protein
MFFIVQKIPYVFFVSAVVVVGAFACFHVVFPFACVLVPVEKEVFALADFAGVLELPFEPLAVLKDVDSLSVILIVLPVPEVPVSCGE